MKKLLLLAIVAILGFATSRAQYFNLTAEEVRIDSRLPIFNHTFDLGTDYLSATDYEVELTYPQFIDMSKADIARLHLIAHDSLPELPRVNCHLSVERKVGKMDVWLLPLVYREGRYQKLVSFGLNLVRKSPRRAAATRASATARYADNSVLREGRWAKIRVGESGVHQLTPEVIKKAGFSDLARVKVYGYGGALQPEKLTADYIAATDDLKEIATYATAGRKLFMAQGPVSWQSNGSRVRNTYSNYGYYFITEGDEPLTADSASFVTSLYPEGNINSKQATHALYEVDDYAWFHGGRHLFDSRVIGNGESRDYTLNLRSDDGFGSITIALTADAATSAMVAVNDTSFNISMSAPGSYDAATLATRTFSLSNIVNGDNKVTITQNGFATMRLDYISMTASAVVAPPNLTTGQFPTAEYVYGITNQNHHADPIADMVIIIPTTQKQRQQAERLAEYHRSHDGMTVNIVPADELFNEFSSGTPDATAYRRYMKMLYDRAATPDEAPKYLLLFGDGAYDNRMLSAEWTKLSPDDFLLCFESENSLNDVSCFV
ncbi:MAG: C25 family cysteine peptidase, partial [Prevotella sp.]